MNGFQQNVFVILKSSRSGTMWLGMRVLFSACLTALFLSRSRAELSHRQPPAQGPEEQGRVRPSSFRQVQRRLRQGGYPGTTTHLCPQSPASHGAKTRVHNTVLPTGCARAAISCASLSGSQRGSASPAMLPFLAKS